MLGSMETTAPTTRLQNLGDYRAVVEDTGGKKDASNKASAPSEPEVALCGLAVRAPSTSGDPFLLGWCWCAVQRLSGNVNRRHNGTRTTFPPHDTAVPARSAASSGP